MAATIPCSKCRSTMWHKGGHVFKCLNCHHLELWYWCPILRRRVPARDWKLNMYRGRRVSDRGVQKLLERQSEQTRLCGKTCQDCIWLRSEENPLDPCHREYWCHKGHDTDGLFRERLLRCRHIELIEDVHGDAFDHQRQERKDGAL